MTCSRSDPAASSAVFNCSRMRSACCSKGALTRISPVLGSNGGSPEMKTMSPARVQVETGAPHFSKLLSNGSTRIISLFTICLPVRLVVSVDVHEDVVVLAEVDGQGAAKGVRNLLLAAEQTSCRS